MRDHTADKNKDNYHCCQVSLTSLSWYSRFKSTEVSMCQSTLAPDYSYSWSGAKPLVATLFYKACKTFHKFLHLGIQGIKICPERPMLCMYVCMLTKAEICFCRIDLFPLDSLSHVRHFPINPSKKDVQNSVTMPLLEENLIFTGRPETHNFSGVLFDMDGTIVDSTDAIVKHWHKCVLLGHALPPRCMSAYCL